MASLRLVEPKQNKLVADERLINPEAAVAASSIDEYGTGINPSVTMEDIYKAWSKVFVELQTRYKFIQDSTSTRLAAGSGMDIVNHHPLIVWFFIKDENGVKKIVKRIEQKVYAFCPILGADKDKDDNDDDGSIEIKLKNAKNTLLIDELTELAKLEGISIERLSQAEQAEQALTIASVPDFLDEEKQKQEEEAQQAELRRQEELKQKLEWEARNPLKFDVPPPFKNQNQSGMFLLGLDEKDLSFTEGDEPVCTLQSLKTEVAANVEPEQVEKVPTQEELNAIGQELFKTHKIHEQMISATNQTTKFFPPYYSVVDQTSRRYDQPKLSIRQSCYVITDIQEIYEKSYFELVKLGQAVFKVFPLDGGDSKDTKTQTWIYNIINGNFIQIKNPSQFGMLFNLSTRAYGTVMHKTSLLLEEDLEVDKKIKVIKDMFLDDFAQTLQTHASQQEWAHLKPSNTNSNSNGDSKRSLEPSSTAASTSSVSTAPIEQKAGHGFGGKLAAAPQRTIQPTRVLTNAGSTGRNVIKNIIQPQFPSQQSLF